MIRAALLPALLAAALLAAAAADPDHARAGETAAAAGATGEARAAVLRAVDGILAADNAADLDGVLAAYTDDAVLLPPVGFVIQGRNAIAAHYRTIFATTRLALRAETIDVEIGGDLAVARGRTIGTATPLGGGAPRAIEDRYLMSLRRGADGVWRIARLSWSPDRRP